jgi:hypothetical protein
VGLPIARSIHGYLEGIAQQAKAEEMVEEGDEHGSGIVQCKGEGD